MAIYQAISKYGLDNFTLEILEYCCKDITIEREQFYLDKLKPEYNLLKKAGSILGFKHSLLSKKKMSERALGRIVSEETRLKKSEALRGRKLSESTKEKIRRYKHTQEAKLRIGLGNPRTRSVQITDLHTKDTTTFSTMTLAAAHLNTTTATIGSYIKSQKPYKDIYLISTLPSKSDS
jgi:group I intron endonuclease